MKETVEAVTVGFALVSPLWEKALFRGVVLEELRSRWGSSASGPKEWV